LPTPLREYTFAEVEEFAARLRGVVGEEGQLLRALAPEEQRYIFNELQLSKIDFRYWCERYCHVSDDKARLVSFKLRPSQMKLLEKFGRLEAAPVPLPVGKSALVLVKARRVGATVLGQAMVAHGVYLRGQAQGLTASDIPENTLKIYQIQNRIYDHLPWWMKAEMDGKVKADHLRFPRLDSDLTFGTGNQKNPLGQGVRVDFAHLSELGTWLLPDQIDDDLLPAFLSSGAPSTFLFLESTAKSDRPSGAWFEEQYRRAKEEKGVYRAAFLSWYDCPEIHSMPAGGAELDARTLAVAARIKRETGFECSREQLAWYRVTREQFESKGKLQEFLAEYPSTDEEAFQHGMRSAITLETRDRIRQQVREPLLVLKWTGHAFREEKDRTAESPHLNRLFVWENPRRGYVYIVAVDGGAGRQDDESKIDNAQLGKGGKDRSAVEVLRVGNRLEPAEQVAEWVGYLKPDDLAPLVAKLGRMYGDRTNEGYPAKVACETNVGSPSGQTQDTLLRLGYPNLYRRRTVGKMDGGLTNDLGWHTTPATRGWLTDGFVSDVEGGNLRVNSLITLSEMQAFVNQPKPTMPSWLGAAPGWHDDTIMSLAIGRFVALEPASALDAKEAEFRMLDAADVSRHAPFNPQATLYLPGTTEVITPENYGEWMLDRLDRY
jgi:hypothetical protein